MVILLLALEFCTLTLLRMAFVLVVKAFAKKGTGDGPHEIILIGNCLPIRLSCTQHEG